ncbi:glycosyltransferase [Bradyrhizobium sp. USDA 3364]
MVMNALEQLRSRYDFELVLVEKTSHEQALEIYRSADLAIDQVLAGWYGGFAVEMMAMGKPVACYIREEDMKFVPDAIRHELPLYRLNPGNLVEDIAAILERRSEWLARGQASRRYVERWHNPEQIAKAMLRAYESPDSDFELIPNAD